jgi:hypothetical protein
MKFSYIYHPVKASINDYSSAVESVVEKLKDHPSISAIYQFGHFNSPGISDIDLMVIFKEGSTCLLDPLNGLESHFRSLFTHSVMGVSEAYLTELMRFSFWHNYMLLYSIDPGHTLPEPATDSSIIPALKKQIATEYLTSNYIDMFMQISTRIIKVRSLLQHVKGFIYDFEFLGYSDPLLEKMVEEIRGMIREYAEKGIETERLGKWLLKFYPEFTRFLKRVYDENPLYLPEKSEYRYGKNIWVFPSQRIDQKHSGIRIPRILPLSDKKYFRLNNRFNSYQFWFPVTFNEPFHGAYDRIHGSIKMREDNRVNYPHFAPLVTRFSLQL